MEMETGMIAEAFEMGGTWMIFILGPALFGNIFAGLAVLFGFYANKRIAFQILGLLAFITGLGMLGLGYIGYTLEMMELNEAMPHVISGHEADLQALGERYASYPLKFGIVASVLPLLAGVLLLWRGLRSVEQT